METEIRSSQFPYDMSAWLVEKSQFILEWLVRLYEDFRKKDDLPEGLMDNLTDWLAPVFYDATKILSFASGGKWSPDDREIILEKGVVGLEEILVKYELLRETTEDRLRRKTYEKIQSFVEHLKELLGEPRDTARTQIHELLFKEGFDNSIVNEISDLTEKVTMGELHWDEYVHLVKNLVRQLESEYL